MRRSGMAACGSALAPPARLPALPQPAWWPPWPPRRADWTWCGRGGPRGRWGRPGPHLGCGLTPCSRAPPRAAAGHGRGRDGLARPPGGGRHGRPRARVGPARGRGHELAAGGGWKVALGWGAAPATAAAPPLSATRTAFAIAFALTIAFAFAGVPRVVPPARALAGAQGRHQRRVAGAGAVRDQGAGIERTYRM
jgi:hypothetical protein